MPTGTCVFPPGPPGAWQPLLSPPVLHPAVKRISVLIDDGYDFKSQLMMLMIFNIMLHSGNFSVTLFSHCFSLNTENDTHKITLKEHA